MARAYPQLVLFGDSLFQASSDINDGFSFQGALQSRFIRRLDVVNRGFSGYNTDNCLAIMDEVFAKPVPGGPKIDYLVVLLGANDAVIPLPSTSQHVPIDRYKENLVKIVTHESVRAHNPKILLVTPPPLDEIRISALDLANGYPEPQRRAAVSAAYSEVVRRVVAEVPGAVLVDLYHAVMERAVELTPGFHGAGGLGTPEVGVQGGLASLLPDGLHMSGAAYRVFFDALVPHIGCEWVGLAKGDTRGHVFPDWRVVNPPAEYPD